MKRPSLPLTFVPLAALSCLLAACPAQRQAGPTEETSELTQDAADGCTADTDCKHDRICDSDGHCVAPPREADASDESTDELQPGADLQSVVDAMLTELPDPWEVAKRRQNDTIVFQKSTGHQFSISRIELATPGAGDVASQSFRNELSDFRRISSESTTIRGVKFKLDNYLYRHSGVLLCVPVVEIRSSEWMWWFSIYRSAPEPPAFETNVFQAINQIPLLVSSQHNLSPTAFDTWIDHDQFETLHEIEGRRKAYSNALVAKSALPKSKLAGNGLTGLVDRLTVNFDAEIAAVVTGDARARDTHRRIRQIAAWILLRGPQAATLVKQVRGADNHEELIEVALEALGGDDDAGDTLIEAAEALDTDVGIPDERIRGAPPDRRSFHE